MDTQEPASKTPEKPVPVPSRPPKPVRFTDWAQI